MWDGGQARQLAWFLARLRAAEESHEYNLLVKSATALIPSSGTIAVFSPKHALEHASNTHVGTFANPNARERENLSALIAPTAANATTAASTSMHGGFPTPNPSTSATSAPTGAATASRTQVLLRNEVGDLAETYRISPDTIEKIDASFLNHFIDYMKSDRLREFWRRKCPTGRKFVVEFKKNIDSNSLSLTANDTIDARMRIILSNGLEDATYASYLEMVGAYEDLNEVRMHPYNEQQLAHEYKNAVCKLSEKIETKLLLRLSILESAAAARGENPARDAPVDLVNEAVAIVLEDAANREILDSLSGKHGNAFNATKFDPARNTRDRPNVSDPNWKYSGPDKWVEGMRPCHFCKNLSISEQDKLHPDLKCPRASSEQKEKLIKERTEAAKNKRQRRRSQNAGGNSGGGGGGGGAGGAKMVKSDSSVDQADADNASQLFNSGQPALVELDALVDGGHAPLSAPRGGGFLGRSLMVSASASRPMLGRLAATHSPLTIDGSSTAGDSTVRTDVAGSAQPSSTTTELPTDGHKCIYVVADCGNSTSDAIIPGVYVGDWKRDVITHIAARYNNDLPSIQFSRSALKQRTSRAVDLEAAVVKCDALGIEPIFRGPLHLDHMDATLQPDACLATFLLNADGGSSSESSAPTLSGDEPESDGGDSEPQLEMPSVANAPSTATMHYSEQDAIDATMNDATVDVESLTVNSHVDMIRTVIRRHQLCIGGNPVSPGTGGPTGRTKLAMLQEARFAVGLERLPDSELRLRRARPDVPMGTAVDAAADNGSSGRKLDFEADTAGTSMATVILLALVFVVQVLMLFAGLMCNGYYVPCRSFLPMPVCEMLGYADTVIILTPPTIAAAPTAPPVMPSDTDALDTPTITGFVRDPGVPTGAEVGGGAPYGGVGATGTLSHIVMPGLVCLILVLHSIWATVNYLRAVVSRRNLLSFDAQAKPGSQGLGHPDDPPRDTYRRSLARRARATRAAPAHTTSRFWRTLGEAPLWVSLVLLVHEVATCIVPSLTALSIVTLVVPVLRAAHAGACLMCSHPLAAPARVTVRIVVNTIVVMLYLLANLAVNTFVSEGATWPPPLQRDIPSPSRTRLRDAARAVLTTMRALGRGTWTDMSQWGGVIIDCVSLQRPSSTDPSQIDYQAKHNPRAPKALHAFNPNLTPVRRARLEHARPVDGRALLGRGRRRKSTTTTTAPSQLESLICWAVVDSGCSWHCHPVESDLINRRKCNDTMTGIDGKPQQVKCIGDLPVLVRDRNGVWSRCLIRNVRCVPFFTDTLISVDQFWQDSKVDCVFNSVRCIHVPATGDAPTLDLPFRRHENLYRWAVVPTQRHGALQGSQVVSNDARALKATIHRAKSTSFFNTLPADEQLRMLQRRLNVSSSLIRRLGNTSADIPDTIQRGKAPDCEHNKVANAARVPHPGKSYKPSHVGRLIHADIAGPFKRSTHGFTYFIVLVDDHSRFKAAYFLKRKSDALARVRAFVTKLNALASRGKPEPVRVVGQLQMDNAGEFLSREFDEFLDEESILRTTCPPHVHQLNGVAERAIRSIMEVVRATREASQCPLGFWPHLVEHAVDVLNRTTGPPYDGRDDGGHGDGGADADYQMTAYEHVVGEAAKILTILPIGCRAYAVKPVGSFSKTEIEPRGWSGINLGKSSVIPGAYNIWLPVEGKIIQTSEVYFDESLFPWRPKGDQRIGEPSPVAAPPEGPASAVLGDAGTSPKGSDVEAPAPATTEGSSHDAKLTSNSSNRLLLLFSGSYQRPDGLAQFARQLGLEVDLFDSDPHVGGGADADILDDKVYESLQARISSGIYVAIFAAPPCSTYSISRFFRAASSKDGGPPPVRTRREIGGCRFLPQKHHEELRRANTITARLCALMILAHRAGTEFVIENPADRGDATRPDLFVNENHGPLWLVDSVCALAKMASTSTVTFAMCAFGAPWQKMTTLMYTAGMSAWLDPLHERRCTHSSHPEVAGGKKTNGTWNSTEAAAYPPDFNSYVAQAVASLVRQRQSFGDAQTQPFDEGPAPAPHPGASRMPLAGNPMAQSTRGELDDNSADTQPAPSSKTLGDHLAAASAKVKSALSSLGDATSVRRLSFGDLDVDDKDESGEAAQDEVQPVRPKRKVTFDKTAGARGTRSQNVPLVRGMGTSAGFAMLALGSSLPAAIYAMGTTHVFEELNRPGGTLRAALAKPGSTDPKTQADAYRMDKPNWVKSEMKELKNHEDNGSWEYIPASALPRGRRLVKMVWVYKVKRDGSLKSRLCVQGCRQVAGIDYDQTWCGAMRGTSLRLLSNLAANSGMRMRRYDFVAAYLQGELLEGETVYCYPPPGHEKFDANGKPMICKILKPVYGMAQAGRRWQRTLFPWLKEFGFTQTQSDQSVFTLERRMHTPNGPRVERLHVGVYVDDLATVYLQDDEHSLYHAFVTALRERWNIEDEGDLTDLLGIEFTRLENVVELRQTKYIEKLAAEFFPDGVPPTAQANKVPCDKDLPALVHMALLDGATPDHQLLKQYQSICGALLYASTNTRPDIAFATGLLCRAMGRPTPELFEAALRVLGYLYRNRHIGLRYESSSKSLEGYSDSDWAVKHSTSGHSFHLGSATISWASKKQSTVALSSCEAEIMAGSEAAKEAIYLSGFLHELGVNVSEPPPLKMDNKSAIDLAYNPEHHSKTKHIERRHYFIRECVENGKLRVPFVPTDENVADFFTKPIMGKQFFSLRDKVMNVQRPSRRMEDGHSSADS